MEIGEIQQIQKIADAVGNRFAAVQLIAKAARNIGTSKEYRCYAISESKLIEWVVTGKCPYSKEVLDKRKIINETIDELEDCLCYISDPDVINEVKRLYGQSLRMKKLQKCTNNNLSPGQQSRVTILLRMIWLTI